MSDRAKINMIFRVNCGKAGEKIMCESIVGVLIGAVIGGIVSLLICWLTIRANNKNIRWERFVVLCKEADIYDIKSNGTPQNKVYSKAQKLLLDFAESKKQESKSAKE